ncbi:TPA: LysR family transcriptional regulator [Stenotrophomonas maltophilia]|nr:LysR family transcriptional regulator [Stenotrophomonas maltophilia]HDS1026884.1 LysR family transcriptional regulator [Stenotrophomonas maltophilia]HDS1031431.1 LysR family transcriptional regulator [Stenotrophomonas maltophilia]HDS1035046.1 LysR family transcriptional regulator [Stenotrophomonas maltophilia]
MMNLAHWRLLVAVADEGTISRAAERVGISQSGASQALAQLESSLGFAVFVRERRQVDVTALGQQVIEHARTMLGGLQAIRALADDSQGLSGARIRLATFPSIVSTVLPALLRDFQRRHPGIEVVVVEGTDEEVEQWLDSGAVDVGVVMNPAPARSPVALGSDAWVAVLAQIHPLGRRATERGIALDELAAEPFILATGGCRVNGQRLMEDAGLHLADVRITVRDWASACVLVREGLGVSLVPESTLPTDRQGLRVLPVAPGIRRVFGLVCSEVGRASRATQVFVQALATAAAGRAS